MSNTVVRRYEAFLSHHSADKPAVEDLARRLEERGVATFLDKWHLIPGTPWQPALELALESSACCVVFVGPSGLGPWQNEEMRAAIARRVADAPGSFRVVPVLLPGARREERSKLPAFLVSGTWVEFKENSADEDAFHRLTCGIRGLPPGPAIGEAIWEGTCPYRGLQVFDAADEKFFFGRDDEVDWMIERLAKDFGSIHETRFLGVIGASGSGKSSLVRAGLLPAINVGRSRNGKTLPCTTDWPVVVVRPGPEPLKSLADGLWANPIAKLAVPDPLSYADQMLADERRLHATIGTVLAERNDSGRFVVVIDQFEEIFTLCGAEGENARVALISNLLYASSVRGGRTIVIVTMRADFYGKCSRYERLAHALADHQELVPPLSEQELRTAIERPAHLCGLDFEAGLVDLLLQEMRQQPAGALPLLQQTLFMLWQRRKGRLLTVRDYREIGRIEGALEAHANGIYSQQLQSDQQREICRHVFLMLTNPGEGTEDTRRRIPRSQLGESAAIENVLQVLVKARLVTVSETDPPRVEVTHEALIRGWKQLRDWLNADRDSLRMLQQLIEAAEEWHSSKSDVAYLFSGSRLVQAEEWWRLNSQAMQDIPLVKEFIEAALRQREGEQFQREVERKRREKIFARFTLTAAALGTIAGISGLIAWSKNADLMSARRNLETEQISLQNSNSELMAMTAQAQELEKEADAASREAHRELANSEFLIGLAARKAGNSIEAAHHFLRAASALDPSKDSAAMRSYCITAAAEETKIIRTFAHSDSALRVSWDRDRQRMLTRTGNSAFLWEMGETTPSFELPHEGEVEGALFSGDGQSILTWSGREARLWSMNQKLIRRFQQADEIRQACLNSDGQFVLTCSRGGIGRVWDIRKEDPIRELPVRAEPPYYSPIYHESGAFTKDGGRVLIRCNHRIELWDVRANELIRDIPFTYSVEGATLSGDEQQILTWSDDYKVRLQNLNVQNAPITVFEHGGFVSGAIFSGDGRQILTWGGNDTIRLWNVNRSDMPVRVFKHEDNVVGATFSVDDQLILSWGHDNTARIWRRNQEQPHSIFWHEGGVAGAVFSRDELQVLTWSDHHLSRLWKVNQNEPLRAFLGGQGASLSADGKRVLIWDYGNAFDPENVYFCDVEREEPLWKFKTEDEIRGAVFSSDGARALTWNEYSAQLWDETQRKASRKFQPEGGIKGAELSSNGEWVITWNDTLAQIRNVTTVTAPGDASPLDAGTIGAMFSSDDQRILTWHSDGTARLWELGGGAGPRQMNQTISHGNALIGAQLCDNGQHVLTWGGDCAKLWKIGQRDAVREFPSEEIRGASVDGVGRNVLTWDDRMILRLWNVEGIEAIRDFAQYEYSLRDAMLSGDGQRVLIQTIDDSLELWDVTKSVPLRVFFNQTVKDISPFSSDEQRLLTSSQDGSTCLWDLSPGDLSEITRRIRQLEIRSGTRLDASGWLRVLTPEELNGRLRETVPLPGEGPRTRSSYR